MDLRQPWWTISNQESTGSCVGWAAADGVGRHQMEHAGKIAKTQSLSARFIWMASKETDTLTARPESFVEGAGTTLKAALDVARRYGYALADDLPFHIQTNMYLGDEENFFAGCAMRKVSAYFNLQKNLADWKMWLATKGPLLVGLSVDPGWDNATANRGIVDTFDPTRTRGGHAVAVVGYRTDGRFIVRNSGEPTGATMALPTFRRATSTPDSSTRPTASRSSRPGLLLPADPPPQAAITA